jgi:hypothetical protein
MVYCKAVRKSILIFFQVVDRHVLYSQTPSDIASGALGYIQYTGTVPVPVVSVRITKSLKICE